MIGRHLGHDKGRVIGADFLFSNLNKSTYRDYQL